MFGNESDEEVEEEDKDELKWRKERYEREKFLQEASSVYIKIGLHLSVKCYYLFLLYIIVAIFIFLNY